MIRTLYLAVAVLITVAGLLAAAVMHERQEQPEPAAATSAPAAPEGRFIPLSGGDFAAVAPVDGSGQPADMTPYRGKRLLVNLWATWCAPCIKELPSLARLQRALGGREFAVVTIAVQERDPARIAPFLAQHGAADLPVLIDREDTVRRVATVTALPTSLLVERDGQVKAMLTGDASWHCGQALAAVKAFIADGTVRGDTLDRCD